MPITLPFALIDFSKSLPFLPVMTRLDKRHLTISFEVRSFIALGLNLAPFCAKKRMDNLWQDTCFECFVGFRANDLNISYLEINAAPHGAYALYRFDDYRTPQPPMPFDGAFLWHTHQNGVYECSVQLPYDPQYMMPAAVLNLHGNLHYFAPSHGQTADFHNKAHWTGL